MALLRFCLIITDEFGGAEDSNFGRNGLGTTSGVAASSPLSTCRIAKYSAYCIGNIGETRYFSGAWIFEIMLGYCSNEKCKRPLHSFTEGRLFQFEITSISVTPNDGSAAPFDEKPLKEAAHFWLCGDCASTFTLVLEPADGIRLVPHEERESKQGKLFGVSKNIVQVKRC